MTNSPTLDEQLALNEYWKQIGGTVMLPETNRSGRLLGQTPVKLCALPGALWVFAPKHTVAET